MSGNADFIAYCIEEYKAAKGITGKEAISLFKKYDIIDYIVTCYGALFIGSHLKELSNRFGLR